jgi:hypothetical protein
VKYYKILNYFSVWFGNPAWMSAAILSKLSILQVISICCYLVIYTAHASGLRCGVYFFAIFYSAILSVDGLTHGNK